MYYIYSDRSSHPYVSLTSWNSLIMSGWFSILEVHE